MIFSRRAERVPRKQRLRKLAKFFDVAERTPENASPGDLADALEYLLRDGEFSAEAHAALEQALQNLRGGDRTRAVNTARHILLAETGKSQADWDFIDHSGKLDPGARRCFPGMALYLEDIRSPYNVGSIFRSAESFGVERLILSPLSADPRHPRAQRSAMGCVEILPWERGPLPPDAPLFALETGGIPLAEFPFPDRGIMLIGSEELGASPEALNAAARSLGRLSIPTFGAKGSLSAAVAAGIALQSWAARLAERFPPSRSPAP